MFMLPGGGDPPDRASWNPKDLQSSWMAVPLKKKKTSLAVKKKKTNGEIRQTNIRPLLEFDLR